MHALGEPPSDELVRWSAQQLSAADDDQTQLASEGPAPETRAGLRYCVVQLRGADAVPGLALVLGYSEPEPRVLSLEVRQLLAAHLSHEHQR